MRFALQQSRDEYYDWLIGLFMIVTNDSLDSLAPDPIFLLPEAQKYFKQRKTFERNHAHVVLASYKEGGYIF